MNRELVSKALPVLQAYAEGKSIEFNPNCNAGWKKLDSLDVEQVCLWPQYYRVKPEPIYRPFENAKECYEEMKKHKPFGWVRRKGSTQSHALRCFDETSIYTYKRQYNYSEALDLEVEFLDGTPFGILEED